MLPYSILLFSQTCRAAAYITRSRSSVLSAARSPDRMQQLADRASHPSPVSPSPVRLRSDRLSLIEECIAECPAAYKQSNTLLNLASLLRVAGTNTTHTFMYPRNV